MSIFPTLCNDFSSFYEFWKEAMTVPTLAPARTQPSDLRITVTKFSDGERYPLLLNESGVPEWYPTLFITTQARNASKAANTMRAMLGSIRFVLRWAELTGISLVDRFVRTEWLRTAELESLFEFTQRRLAEVAQTPSAMTALELPSRRSKADAKLTRVSPRVLNDSHYVRLTYSAKYIGWLAKTILEEDGGSVSEHDRQRISEMTGRLEAHRPIRRAESRIYARQGLADGARKALNELVRQDSTLNPFEETERRRNELIVHTLIELGPRSGELLQIKTTDYDFVLNEVVIGTRRDDPDDPRANEPVPKTLDRRLGVTRELSKKSHEYIIKDRKLFPMARKHTFLFVTHKAGPHQGQPLSQRGLNEIFARLRRANRDSLSSLSPHVLRHTSNDDFSDWADAQQLSEAREEQLRSYKYGWKYGSGTAAIYNRRRIEREVKQATLKLQTRTSSSRG
jgi:integrase